MIITRTPFRISFFGGGTDFPLWFQENGGAVLSTAINRYCYISVRQLPPFFDYKYRIRYTLTEHTQDIKSIHHPSVRECLRFMKIREGIEMVHSSDIPAKSGIGSSSAFTVGFLNALYALKGGMVARRQLAQNAIFVEQERIREIVGCQDQIASAFGGLNWIEFKRDSSFVVHPVIMSPEAQTRFSNHIMLFFTGFSRTSSKVAEKQHTQLESGLISTQLKTLQELVPTAANILTGPARFLNYFGELLHESWIVKRSLSTEISSSAIDRIYNRARKHGAIGGKLCGAGGGGFLMLFVPPDKRAAVKKALSDLVYVPFGIDHTGSQITYFAPERE